MYCVYATDQGIDLDGEVQLETLEQVEQAAARLSVLARREAKSTGTPLSRYAVDIDWHGPDCRTNHGAERGIDGTSCDTIETRDVTP